MAAYVDDMKSMRFDGRRLIYGGLKSMVST